MASLASATLRVIRKNMKINEVWDIIQFKPKTNSFNVRNSIIIKIIIIWNQKTFIIVKYKKSSNINIKKRLSRSLNIFIMDSDKITKKKNWILLQKLIYL